MIHPDYLYKIVYREGFYAQVAYVKAGSLVGALKKFEDHFKEKEGPQPERAVKSCEEMEIFIT